MNTPTNTVHNHYVRCECSALYSDTLASCVACGRANPEAPTLNAADPDSRRDTSPGLATAPRNPALQPTLNGADPPESK